MRSSLISSNQSDLMIVLLFIHLFILVSGRNWYGSDESIEGETLPGAKRFLIQPQVKVKSDQMAFAFGRARRDQEDQRDQGDENPFLMMKTNEGERLSLPKGIYHYGQHDVGFDAHWTLPQENRADNWWIGDTNIRNNYRNIDGVYLKNPLSNTPLNIQVITEKNWEHGLEGKTAERNPHKALERAQRICANDEGSECERALNEYYEIQAESIAQANTPLHERLVQLGEIASTTRFHSKTGNGLGLMMDVPGQEEPLYFGASLNGNREKKIRLEFPKPIRLL